MLQLTNKRCNEDFILVLNSICIIHHYNCQINVLKLKNAIQKLFQNTVFECKIVSYLTVYASLCDILLRHTC